jgi:hypothetical protein
MYIYLFKRIKWRNFMIIVIKTKFKYNIFL